MAAGQYTFQLEQGTTVNFRIDYLDTKGNPVNLTDWNARMDIRAARDKTSQLYMSLTTDAKPDGTGLTITPLSGSVVLPPTSGSIGLFISAASSSMLNFSDAHYDIEIYSGSSNEYVIRLLEGKIRLRREVTA